MSSRLHGGISREVYSERSRRVEITHTESRLLTVDTGRRNGRREEIVGVRIIDLHCYPNTEPWIRSQGPYVEALAKYWNRAWTAKTEQEVINEFTAAGVEAVLVAFDIESVTGSPPCTNRYVAKMRDAHPGVIRQAWAAVDPLKGETAIAEAKTAIKELGLLGFHFHPIMGHFSVDERRFYPLWETIEALNVPVMIDVGTTGMGAGMPGGLGAVIRHAPPTAVDR